MPVRKRPVFAAALAGAGYGLPCEISRAASLAEALHDPIGRCGPAFAGARSCRGEVLGQIWSVLSVGKVIRSRQFQRATSFSLKGGLFASGNSA